MEKRLSRRKMLTAMGGAGLGVGLTACGVVTSPNQSGAPTPKASKKIRIPSSGAKLPKTPVTLGWMDSNDLKALWERPVFAAYQQAHANIKINYDGTAWDTINQVIPLGVKNGSAPDVFAVPSNVPHQIPVKEGWVAPIDDIIPNFKAWKAAFPSTAFVPGLHVFGGKTYTWPINSSQRYPNMLMYDVEYLQQAGYDPASHRLTFTEFRAACKKITTKGAGQYYGLMMDGQQVGAVVAALAELSGVAGGEFNWKTGQYNYAQPGFIAAAEYLLAIKQDGSIFPGFLALGDAQGRARMPQRVAGMMFDGPWDIPKWPQINPNFKFNIAMPPMPDSKAFHNASYQEIGGNQLWVYAESKNKAVIGDVFSYMGSLQGQVELVVLSQGNLVSEMPQANELAGRSKLLDPLARSGVAIADKLMRVAPLPQQRNVVAGDVILAQGAVKPSLNDVVQGILSGQIKDIKGALKDLSDRTEADLDQAIKTVQARGEKVSRNDWVFPNWDPGRDYSQQDYSKLSN